MNSNSLDLSIPKILETAQPHISCKGCALGSMQRSRRKTATLRTPRGHTLVTDIAGPLPQTLAGMRYFLTVTEIHTRLKNQSLDVKSRS